MKLSARNQISGKVLSIKEGVVNASVKVDIGGGNIISSTITLEAVKDLDLKVGSDVTTVIKSSSVLLMV